MKTEMVLKACSVDKNKPFQTREPKTQATKNDSFTHFSPVLDLELLGLWI